MRTDEIEDSENKAKKRLEVKSDLLFLALVGAAATIIFVTLAIIYHFLRL